jgi:hypothetical protein
MKTQPLRKVEGPLEIGKRLSIVRERYTAKKEKGAFHSWIQQNHSSIKSAYNSMAYYAFYSQLKTKKQQTLFLSLPQKVAFILASRSHAFKMKCYVLEQTETLAKNELTPFIRKKLPIDTKDKRASRPEGNQTHFDAMNRHLDHLEKKLRHMGSEELEQFGHLHYRLEQMLCLY